MTLARDDIAAYEGLIYSTAARYAPLLDDDIEDVAQLLRVKVWQALEAYDRRRVRIVATNAKERFVFSCVTNRVKDMLKAQSRLNSARQSSVPHYIEDESRANPDRFQQDYLFVSDDEVFATVEEESYELPSTLTEFERAVVVLLLLDFNQTQIAGVLSASRARVRSAHTSVKEKMADWKPSAAELPVAA